MTAPEEAPVYLLNDGDEWFVYVHGHGVTLWADGEAAEVAPGHRGSSYERWYVVDHRPEVLELVGEPGRELVRYELPEDTSIEGLPREMTPPAWRERFHDEDGEVDDVRAKLYGPVFEPREAKRTRLVTPPLVLEGRPPGGDGFTWVAKLPHELRQRPEYLHLFPGHIENEFREALYERIDKLPYVTYCFKHQPGPLKVTVRVQFDPVVWWPKKNGRGRVVKKGTAGYVSHELSVAAPRQITGANRAEAVALWHAEMKSFLEAVEEATFVVPCGYCEGRGWTERPEPEPEPEPPAPVAAPREVNDDDVSF